MLIQCMNCANKDKSHHADGKKVVWCNAEHQFRAADFERKCENFQPEYFVAESEGIHAA